MKTYKVELTEDFIKQAHEVACPEWKIKIRSLVPEAFEKHTEAKVNTWYKIDDVLFLTTEINNAGVHYGYRIEDNQWSDCTKGGKTGKCACNEVAFKDRAIEATDKEVEQALIKEAKKRGLVNRAEIVCLHDNTLQKTNNEKYCFALAYNELWLGTGILLFENGKWAKPIENPTLKRIQEIEAELKQLKEKL